MNASILFPHPIPKILASFERLILLLFYKPIGLPINKKTTHRCPAIVSLSVYLYTNNLFRPHRSQKHRLKLSRSRMTSHSGKSTNQRHVNHPISVR